MEVLSLLHWGWVAQNFYGLRDWRRMYKWFYFTSVVQTIPRSLWKRKSFSAIASMIFESSLHCTISESKEMILPRWLHNLLPQISPPNHLDKIPSPYYHKDTFSKRYRFSFSKSLMAFRHTFSEIKLLNFCRGKARVNLIWDFIRYIRQRFWGWK